MECRHRGSKDTVGNGSRTNAKQNYLCGSCGRRFVEAPSPRYRISEEKTALINRLPSERIFFLSGKYSRIQEKTMELEIITIYRREDFSISVDHKDDPRSRMSTAEMMTTALTAAAFFFGDHEKSRYFLGECGYLTDMLLKSQFSRRLHRIPESFRRGLMDMTAQAAPPDNPVKNIPDRQLFRSCLS